MAKQQNVRVKPFKYENFRVTPKGYVCGCCGKSGVKLWREWNTMLDSQTLYCFSCGQGGNPTKPFLMSDGRDYSIDQITHPKEGALCAAVPTENGRTYWGYSAVPSMGCLWWRSLPAPDWTNEIVLSDYRDHLSMIATFKESLRKVDTDESKKYYKDLLDSSKVALDALLKEILSRMSK